MLYPLLQFSFFRSYFFREVSVNDDIAVKLIVFCSRKCLREEIDSRDTFNIYLLDPYWSQKKRILYTPFFWHSIGWVEIFYLFIFIWSRNPFQKFYRDVSEVLLDEELLGLGVGVGPEKWVLPLWCCITHCIFFWNSPWDITLIGLKIRRTICLRYLAHPLFSWQGHPLLLGRVETM